MWFFVFFMLFYYLPFCLLKDKGWTSDSIYRYLSNTSTVCDFFSPFKVKIPNTTIILHLFSNLVQIRTNLASNLNKGFERKYTKCSELKARVFKHGNFILINNLKNYISEFYHFRYPKYFTSPQQLFDFIKLINNGMTTINAILLF